MSIVNFAIPQTLERRIEHTVKEKGFASRAELFRFAVIRYLDEEQNLPLARNANIARLSDRLGQAIGRNISAGRLPSLQKQLKRMGKL